VKAVLLDGSLNGEPATSLVRGLVAAELEARGWNVQPFTLREMEIRPCIGCFGCWVQTPGQCLIDDAAREIAPAVIGSDLVIYLTPVTFGGYSSELKKALDRCICLILPFFTKVDGEVHHKPRYDRYPRLLGLGLLPEADAESERIFKTLVGRNAINMHAPAHAAGVILDNQPADAVRAEIQTLLEAVEVK
jgi:hypothetical protein